MTDFDSVIIHYRFKPTGAVGQMVTEHGRKDAQELVRGVGGSWHGGELRRHAGKRVSFCNGSAPRQRRCRGRTPTHLDG